MSDLITEDRDAWDQRSATEWRLGPYRIRCTALNGVLHYRACYCPRGFLPDRSEWFTGRDAPAEARRWCVADAGPQVEEQPPKRQAAHEALRAARAALGG